MDTVKTSFEWLAMMAGFVNAISFVPQMRRMYLTKSSQDISLTTYRIWMVILLISVIHLFLQGDYFYGTGLGSSWITCCTTYFVAYYYQRRNIAPRSAAQ